MRRYQTRLAMLALLWLIAGSEDQKPGVPSTNAAAAEAKPIDLTQGWPRVTMRPLDVAIQGRGFFRVKFKDGLAYTRNGSFSINKQNELVLGSGNGYELVPAIMYPAGTAIDRIDICQSGLFSVAPINGTTHQVIGQIQLYDFPNPGRLKPLGHGLYAQTDQTGAAKPEEIYGVHTATLLQHFLELRPSDAAN